MITNPLQLDQLDNKEAAAVAAYALSRLGSEKLGFKSDVSAFEQLGDLLSIKPNSVKNFRDEFDPHTGSSRAGRTREGQMSPSYLNEVYFAIKGLSDKEITGFVRKLMSWVWLDDIQAVWAECERDLQNIEDVLGFEPPAPVMEKFKKFMEKDGFTVLDTTGSEISFKSRSGRVRSILNFTYLPHFKAIIPYINCIQKYSGAAAKLSGDLLEVIPEANGNEQKLFNILKSGSYEKKKLLPIGAKHLGFESSFARFLWAVENPRLSGIAKSVFRGDMLISACLGRLGLEVTNTGYVGHILSYILKTGDTLGEINLNQETGSGRSHQAVKSKPLSDLPVEQYPRNVIFYGAPGTGKSYSAKSCVPCEEKHFHRTVFSAEYQNSDFVGTIKPLHDQQGNLTYDFEPGPMVIALMDALDNPGEPVVLLIEEINRGNAPAVFGEFFQLLDRDNKGMSEYSIRISETLRHYMKDHTEIHAGGKIALPANLFILATMNSSDQGVFPLDTAFKRRFTFRYIPIKFEGHSEKPPFKKKKINIGGESFTWPEFAETVNSLLPRGAGISEDRLLGPFFLSPTELEANSLDDAISAKVLVYLWEDVLRHSGREVIFDPNIHTFAEIQQRYLREENVFSQEFVDAIREEAASRTDTGGEIDSDTVEEEESEDGDMET